MLRLASSLCPFCEARAFVSPAWLPRQSTRAAATMQQRRPSRMVLSPNVRRSSPVQDAAHKRPVRKNERRGPFGGMNVSAAPRDVEAAKHRVTVAEQTRASKRHKGGDTSKDPMKALKMQRALSNISYEKRSRIKSVIMERERFDGFDLMPVIKESISSQALGGLVDISPTPIQRLAIPSLLGMDSGKRRKRRESSKKMQQFLLAAETGSGKTLAYILPVIDAIKRAEYSEAAKEAREIAREQKEQIKRSQNKTFELETPSTEEPDPSTARPRAIILVPTAELVDQVGHVLKNLSHTVKFRAALISANYTGKVIRSRLFTKSGIDVVVCTPHLLNSITESDPNILARVTHLIIDEADSLFDRSFSPITSSIVDRATPSLEQLILCSATIPRNLDSYLNKRYPDIQRLVTPNLHAIPRRVQLSVVDIEKIPFQGNRDLACAQTIMDIGRDTSDDSNSDGAIAEKKIVVFVNERDKAAEVATYLRSKGIDAVALSRDSDERKQTEVLSSFTGTGSTSSSSSPSPPAAATKDSMFAINSSSTSSRRPLANTKVLVMTDLGSRGIDTLPVRHVVLYDVPHTSIDFIHRLGRVGRMGRRGRGVVLVGRHDRRDVVKEVREGMFRGQALI